MSMHQISGDIDAEGAEGAEVLEHNVPPVGQDCSQSCVVDLLQIRWRRQICAKRDDTSSGVHRTGFWSVLFDGYLSPSGPTWISRNHH
jgi:hypothetical protein